MTPDVINALFEFVGAFILCFNVKALLRDKVVHGFNPWTTVFFTAWGLWNCIFYPILGQWWSFVGGLAIVSVNTIWLGLLVYYTIQSTSRLKEDITK